MKKIMFFLLCFSIAKLNAQYNLYYGLKSKYNCDSVLNCITNSPLIFNNDIGISGGVIGQGFPLVRNTFTNQAGFYRAYNGGSFAIGLNTPLANTQLSVKGSVTALDAETQGNADPIIAVKGRLTSTAVTNGICFDAYNELGTDGFSTLTGFNQNVYNRSHTVSKGFNYFIGSGGSADNVYGCYISNQNPKAGAYNHGVFIQNINSGAETYGVRISNSNTGNSYGVSVGTSSTGANSYGFYHLCYGSSPSKVSNFTEFSGASVNAYGSLISYISGYNCSRLVNYWADATRNNTIGENYGFRMDNKQGGTNVWGAYLINDSCNRYRGVYIGNNNKYATTDDIAIEIDQSLNVGTKKAIKVQNNSGVIDFGNNDINTVDDIFYTGSLTNISDVNAKENLSPVSEALPKITMLSKDIYYYNLKPEYIISTRYPEYGTFLEEKDSLWTNVDSTYSGYIEAIKKRDGLISEQVKKLSEEVHIGTIAQTAQAVFGDIIVKPITLNGTEYLSVDYPGLIPYLIKSIGELEARIKDLENR